MSALHPPLGMGRLLVVALLVVSAVATGPGAALANATFAEGVFTERRGDVASIPIVLSGTDEATVGVEATEGTFRATLTVVDRNGDGRVTLRFNTYLAARNATRAFEATGTDGVSIQTVRADDMNAPNDLELSVVTRSGSNEPDDMATLLVSERHAESLDAWVAPRSLAGELTNPTAIERYRRNGTITNGPVLQNDLLVFRLRASGLGGALAAQAGSNATERFVSMLESPGPNLTIEQKSPSPSFPAKELQLNDTRAITFVPDGRNDTYYLVVDVARVRVDPEASGWSDPPADWMQVREGEELRAAFAFDGKPSPWNADERPGVVASRKFALVQRQAAIETPGEFGPWYLRPEAGQEIAGHTNVWPGTRLNIVIRARNGTFHREYPVVVTEDRQFHTSANLSTVPEGTELRVDVRYENRSLLSDLAHAVVDYFTTVSHSGFVVLHEGSVDGPILDNSDYLSPGTYPWATVSLDDRPPGNYTFVAVVHRDADGDRSFDAESDPPYATNEIHQSDVRTVRIPDWGTPTTTTITPTGTAITDRTTDDRTSGQPGFGPVVALLALLATVAFARRCS